MPVSNRSHSVEVHEYAITGFKALLKQTLAYVEKVEEETGEKVSPSDIEYSPDADTIKIVFWK